MDAVAARTSDDVAPPSADALRARDARAFEWLVERTRRIVLGLGQSVGLRGADLDDAAAEVYLAVYRALPGYQGSAKPTTWVYPIAVRTLTRWRTTSRARQTPTLARDVAAPLDDTADTDDRDAAIWAAVARLDPRAAMAVELFYRRGMSVDDVAAALSCPPNTVKTILHRARAQLRPALEKIGANL